MGAGTSNIDHLSGLQKKELTRQMKAEYLRCLKLVMTPDEQQTLLLKKYDEALADVQANPFKNLVSAKKSKTKDESSVRESRRRSFDKNADNTEENATAVNTDTWDSVSFQPSCVLCGMVFASTEKLNHHIKQSVSFRTVVALVDSTSYRRYTQQIYGKQPLLQKCLPVEEMKETINILIKCFIRAANYSIKLKTLSR